MVLLVSTYSQNLMKNYSIWLKTERENIFFNDIDFTKIAATVPLCNERAGTQPLAHSHQSITWSTD